MQQWLAVFVVCVAGLAGCAEPSEPAEPEEADDVLGHASGSVPVAPDAATFVGTIANDHATGDAGHVGHQLPDLHAEAYNLELLDFNDLSEGLVGYGSGYIEIHAVGDLMLVSSVSGSRGATLVDISDPADMHVLSHIYNLDDNWDARLSDDGQYLFLGCQGSSAFDCTGIDDSGEQPSVTGGGPCASVATCPGGIAVFDIIDPTNPKFIDYVPMGFTHNVYSFMKDGKYYFMNAVVTIAEWDPENGTTQIASTEIQGVHDIFVQEHPITGEHLLYTGSGGGMSIWDVSDPFEPVLIGNIDAQDGASMWHEQTPMRCLIHGRHITIGAGESGAGAAQPVAVMDTTDPRNPVYLGQWQLPDAGSITTQNTYRFSLHNIDTNCDGQVAVGHYHAGVWVFDISTPERMLEPVTLAYYQPHERSISPGWSPVNQAAIGAFVSADTPNVWAAQWSADGQVLFVPDMTTGLYALSPTWDFEDKAEPHDH